MGNMTLDKLAEMVARGFEEATRNTNSEFNAVHEEFGLMKNRIDSVEMELIEIKKGLVNVVYRREYEILKDRVDALEKRIKSTG